MRARGGKRLRRLLARLVRRRLVTGHERANRVCRGGVQRFRVVTARSNLALDRVERVDSRQGSEPPPARRSG